MNSLDIPQSTSIEIVENVPHGVYYLSKICHFNGIIKGFLNKLRHISYTIEEKLRERQSSHNKMSVEQMKEFSHLSNVINMNSNHIIKVFGGLDLPHQIEQVEHKTTENEIVVENRYETIFNNYINTQKNIIELLSTHLKHKQKVLNIISI